MRYGAIRSWSVATGIVAALAGLTASPATAAPRVTSHIVLPDTLVAAGQTGSVTPVILTSGDTIADNLKIVVDARGVAGFATVDVTGLGPCTQAPADVWTCSDPESFETGDLFFAPVFVEMTAAADATPGTTGAVVFTFTADGVTGDTRSAKLTVGEGVDLGAVAGAPVTAAVGTSFVTNHSVVNAGQITAHGAVAVFDGDYPIVATTRYSNCTYLGDVLRSCEFGDDLLPGHSYAIAMPYKVRDDALAPDRPLLENGWFTTGDFAVLRDYIAELGESIGTSGSGAPLKLTDTTTPALRSLAVPQTDVNGENNFADTPVSITGQQRADVAVLGDAASGAVGSTVAVTVGLTDNGPAAVYTHDPEDMPAVDVVIPAGMTVTAADPDCATWDGSHFMDFGQPGARHYRCLPFAYLTVGQKHTFAFTMRIDATGVTTAPVKAAGWGPDSAIPAQLDANTANDTAAIVLTGTGTGPSASTTPATGGTGGGLPVTGTPVAIVAGAGVILAGAGLLLFRMARRRRLTEV